MSKNSEKLEFTISLSTKASDQIAEAQIVIDEANKVIDSLKEKIEKIHEEIAKDTAVPKEKTEEAKKEETKKDKEDKSEAVEFIESLDTKQLSNLRSLATNPEGFAVSQFLSFLTKGGPHGAAIVGIITAAVSAPAVIIEIVKVLSQPGGPLNRDWRRFIEKQIDIGLTREQEKRKALGSDVVIFVQQRDRGYVTANEIWTSNNQVRLNDNRISRIGLNDRENGLMT